MWDGIAQFNSIQFNSIQCFIAEKLYTNIDRSLSACFSPHGYIKLLYRVTKVSCVKSRLVLNKLRIPLESFSYTLHMLAPGHFAITLKNLISLTRSISFPLINTH